MSATAPARYRVGPISCDLDIRFIIRHDPVFEMSSAEQRRPFSGHAVPLLSREVRYEGSMLGYIA